MRLFFLGATFVLAALMTLLHQVALEHYWYWKNTLFDMGMHLLGGVTLGMFAVGLARTHRFFFFTLFVCVGSIAWEVFEYTIGVSKGKNFVSDTSVDLLMDIVGALLVYSVVRLTLWRSK